MMEEEHQGEEETMDNKEPPEEPTKVYDVPVDSLSSRTLIKEVGVEILKYDYTEGSDLNETWVINYPKAMSPNGSLSMTLSQKNGEYLGKQITSRRDWDYEKCADKVIAGRGEIVFKWRHKFDGAVEISTPFFGRYCTGSTASVANVSRYGQAQRDYEGHR
jgi:hypothetical protein